MVYVQDIDVLGDNMDGALERAKRLEEIDAVFLDLEIILLQSNETP